MFDLGTCRVLTKEIIAFPVPQRSDGSGNKSAAAVRADVVQDVVDTGDAERTLVGADARFE